MCIYLNIGTNLKLDLLCRNTKEDEKNIILWMHMLKVEVRVVCELHTMCHIPFIFSVGTTYIILLRQYGLG